MGIGAGSLGEAVLDLVADGTGLIDDINKQKPGVLGALDNLGKVGGLLLAAGITAAATAIIGITAMIWQAGGTIDAAYDQIAISTGATGAALEELQMNFDTVFSNVPASAEDAAAAISGLNQRLGMTGPVLEETSQSLLEMTRLTGGDLSTNIEQFTRFMGDAGIANEDATKTLDTLFVASQQTGVGIDRLMQLAVQFGAPMRSFGFSWEESIAMLGKWEKEGVNTELVMGSLRIAAGKFANENKPLKQGLEETFKAIKNAKDGSKALALAMDVFGARAGPDMAAAIRENRFELGDLVGTLENADGAIARTATSTMDWGERWTLFKNRITSALGPAGMGLMEAVNAALTALETILARPDIQAGLMAIVNGIVWLAQTAAANLPGMIDQFFNLVAWLQANQGVVVAILAVLGASFLALGVNVAVAAWTAMAPLLPIVAALAAIGLAAYILYTAWTENWGGIQDIVSGFWAWLQPILQNLWDWLAINVPLAFQTLANFWTSILQPALRELWNWLATNIPAAIQALANYWNNTLYPAFLWLESMINLTVIPALAALAAWFEINISSAIAKLMLRWGELQIAMFMVNDWIDKNLMPLLNELGDLLGMTLFNKTFSLANLLGAVLVAALQYATWAFGNLKSIIEILAPYVGGYVNWAFGNLKAILEFLAPYVAGYVAWSFGNLITIIKTLGEWARALGKWIQDGVVWAFGNLTAIINGVTGAIRVLNQALHSISLPSWMTPGSPTPWEIGLWGIDDALQAVSGVSLPQLSANLGAMPAPALATGNVMAGLSAGGVPVQFVYSPMISTADQYEAERVLKPFIEKSIRQAKKQ